MGQVTLSIGGRSFAVSCADGEEEHIRALARSIDEAARQSGDPSTMTESRMLLFGALVLADRLQESSASTADDRGSFNMASSNEGMRVALDRLAERAEKLADAVEDATGSH